MALPISGKKYVFICDGARSGNEPKVLNLYYPGSIVNGQNVCLWTKDGSLEQQWKFDGSKLLNMRNTRYALDKYTVAGNANNNNADVWEANDPTNQNIVFEAVSGNIVKIKLVSSGLYLTAFSDAHGNNTNKTPTSTGNVFWAAKKTSKLQQWEFVEVGGSVDPEPPEDGETLAKLKKKFPHGKYWNHVGMSGNNQDGYTNSPCPSHDTTATCNCYVVNGKKMAWQCQGFAMKCGYDAYGSDPYTWPQLTNVSALDNLKPGDIVRYYTTNNEHSIFVTAVSGDTVTFGDCNGTSQKCQIRWDATTTKQKLRSVLKTLYRAPLELK